MFKSQQVLRTKIQFRTADRRAVPIGTRVVVMGVKAGKVRVKIVDPMQEQFVKVRLTGKPELFALTHRGRPKLAAE